MPHPNTGEAQRCILKDNLKAQSCKSSTVTSGDFWIRTLSTMQHVVASLKKLETLLISEWGNICLVFGILYVGPLNSWNHHLLYRLQRCDKTIVTVTRSLKRQQQQKSNFNFRLR